MVTNCRILYLNPTIKLEEFVSMFLKKPGGNFIYDGEKEYTGTDKFRWSSLEFKQEFESYILNEDKLSIKNSYTSKDGYISEEVSVIKEDDLDYLTMYWKYDIDCPKESEMYIFYTKSYGLFLGSILWKDLAYEDNGIIANSDPIKINLKNIELAEGIINHSVKYKLPVIYVTETSMKEAKMNISLNYDTIAYYLAGYAYLMVESNIYVHEVISDKCREKLPLANTVTMFRPDGTSELLFDLNTYSSDTNVKELEKMISRKVKETEESKEIPMNCRFESIRFSYMLENREQTIESISESYERELNAKNNEIESLQAIIKEKNAELVSLKMSNVAQTVDEKSNDSLKEIKLRYVENDMYIGEMKDIILKLIHEKLRSMESDNKQKTSRKYDVLKTFANNNKIKGNGDDLAKQLITISKGSDFSIASTRQKLEKLGFKFEKKDGGHWNITYQGDVRYVGIASSTPSDRKSSELTARQLAKKLFE